MMSSGSGPARLEEKGTLKDRLTWVPGGMTGGAEVAVEGRLIEAVTGISWLDLENEKPVEGVIFSQPCRACAGKFESLCMVVEDTPGGVGGRRWVGESKGKKDEEDGERSSSWRASERRARQNGLLIGCTRDGGPQRASNTKSNLALRGHDQHQLALASRGGRGGEGAGKYARRVQWVFVSLTSALFWRVASSGSCLDSSILLLRVACLLSWAVWWWWTESLHILDQTSIVGRSDSLRITPSWPCRARMEMTRDPATSPPRPCVVY